MYYKSNNKDEQYSNEEAYFRSKYEKPQTQSNEDTPLLLNTQTTQSRGLTTTSSRDRKSVV